MRKYNLMTEFDSIDAYIETFPPAVKARLSEIRGVIRRNAPEATEKISYGMPTFYLHGNLVHYAGYAKHIGFYPTPSGIARFEHQLTGFKFAKGSVQFRHEEPLPLELIARMVAYRRDENLAKAKK